ncbi:hypothetical protein COV93_05925 [Candidatus Woesearchaeota archaeon CG11_big_fil_rev_8_21_14_0_20_43_8]|nr:MAG: hypothetical protein COV93_05925 [Candidatus Woesearchaeota archaeon CG11_big_fil_rev_8_21_14_0_20_43_8]
MDELHIAVYSIIGAALLVATITDIRKREVPDWLNYGLIFLGVSVRGIYSLIHWDYVPFLEGLIGLAVFVGLAYVMFYAGQWGGGDSKLLMGIGSLIGIELSVFTFDKFPFMLSFIINLMFFGAIYGLCWSLVLAVKNRKMFLKEVRKLSAVKKIKKIKIVLAIVLVVSFAASFFIKNIAFKIMLLVFVMLAAIGLYAWIFIKAVEKASMFKWYPPKRLTEGDWIADDVYIGKKYICGPKDLGIEKKQIAILLKHKVKKVLVREGIPFVPSFLIAFIVNVFFQNWFLRFLVPF